MKEITISSMIKTQPATKVPSTRTYKSMKMKISRRLSIALGAFAALLAFQSSFAGSYESNLLAIASNNLVAYWPLNETAGTSSGTNTAYDYAGGFNGTYGVGSQDGIPAQVPPAFPGFPSGTTALQTTEGSLNSYVTVPPLNLDTTTFTLIEWLYPLAAQTAYAAPFLCNAGSTIQGLDYIGSGADLCYRTGSVDGGPSYAWDSGISPPLNQWSMVVLELSPTNATISMFNASGAQTATTAAINPAENFDGVSLIGSDGADGSGGRTFDGYIDQVAIFNNTNLTTLQVASIYDASADISVVTPYIVTQPQSVTVYATGTAQFSVFAESFNTLSYQWASEESSNGPSTDILGATSDSLTLTNVSATNASFYIVTVSNSPGPGSFTSTPVALTVITPVGESYESNIVLGSAARNLVAYWRLNELTDPFVGGVVAYDYWGGFNGVYGVNTANGADGIVGPQPPAFPGFESNNTAMSPFSGEPDSSVTVPALNVNTNTLTIVAWIYPTAIQMNAVAIFFCRDGTTTSGMNYTEGANNQLSLAYTWANNVGTYGWDSGIVPPVNQWSMVALSVTASGATIYIVNTNGFLFASNNVANVVQNFDGVSLIGDDSYDGNSGTRTFTGTIDEVSVFNTSLSLGQISALYATAAGLSKTFPTIETQPETTTNFVGQTVEFSVLAEGAATLTYQWQYAATGSGPPYTNLHNGGQISGATNATLTIQNINNSNALVYVVVVSNSSGSLPSSPATLTIVPDPASITLNYTGSGSGSEQMPYSQYWDTPGYWWDGLQDGGPSATALASIGVPFVVPPGSIMRTPDTVAAATFPGAELDVDGDGNFTDSAVTGDGPVAGLTGGLVLLKGGTDTEGESFEVRFTNLVLNGGQVDVQEDSIGVIDGGINISTNGAFFYADTTDTADLGFQINSVISGFGQIQEDLYSGLTAYNTGYVNSLNITGTNNPFTGMWLVIQGPLLGSGPNSLGTNSIDVSTNGALETLYNINDPNASLTLNGMLFLHTADTFQTVIVNGTNLNAGTYTSAQLTAALPANFPASWTQLNGSTVSTASGTLTVLQPAAAQPTLSFTLNPLTLNWTRGTLMQATNLLGPWVASTNTAPYQVSPTNDQMYFRVTTLP